MLFDNEDENKSFFKPTSNDIDYYSRLQGDRDAHRFDHLLTPISDLDLREGDLLCGAQESPKIAVARVSKVHPNGNVEITYLEGNKRSFVISSRSETYWRLYSRDGELINHNI